MDPLLKWLPLHHGLQTILTHRVDFEPFKEKILYIMKVEKFAQPIHHQTIQTFSPNIDPPLDPTLYLSQIGDEMEEGLPGIFKKRLEIFTMNDDTDIGCVIQDLKALHDPQFRLSLQVTQSFSFP
jgi:hypothetical protein